MFKKINFVEFIINIDKLEKIVEFVNKYIIFYIYRLLQDFMMLEKYLDVNVILDNVFDMIFLKLLGG